MSGVFTRQAPNGINLPIARALCPRYPGVAPARGHKMDAAGRLGTQTAVVCGEQSPRVSSMIKKQQSLSYEELSRANLDELERLAEADLLDDATRFRCAHLARFFEKIRKMGPAELKICDVLTEGDLEKIWRETANEDASPHATGQRHLVH
jgi:hypothetical protein